MIAQRLHVLDYSRSVHRAAMSHPNESVSSGKYLVTGTWEGKEDPRNSILSHKQQYVLACLRHIAEWVSENLGIFNCVSAHMNFQ